jgi:hypothetical protein
MEEEKVEAAFHYFSGILGTTHDRDGRLDFEALGIHRRDLSSLGRPFTADEIWVVVKELPLDKAPGPDGFTGHFYHSAWLIIKRDVIRAFDALSSMDCRSFHHLNDALLILLPKLPDPVSLGDYRPISLIHNFGIFFQKRYLTALLRCCRSWFPQTRVLLSKVATFRTISDVSWGRQRF